MKDSFPSIISKVNERMMKSVPFMEDSREQEQVQEPEPQVPEQELVPQVLEQETELKDQL